MPIRINLLAEAIAAEDLRRRDPVKRAIISGSLLVALSLVWYSSTWLTFMVDKEKLNHLEAEIQTHTNDYGQVQSDLKKMADAQKRIDALAQLASTRFLEGTILNALQKTYVPNVQLNHLHVDQTYSASAPVKAKTGSAGAQPASNIEHVVLTMDAKDFSPNPGDQVNHYRDALLKQDYFKSCFDPVNGIKLSALSALQTGEGKPYVTFSLECHFLDRP